MQLKYNNYHAVCISCRVPTLSVAQAGLAYRLVPDAFPTDDDFLPPAIMKPERSFRSAEQRCSAYALSFFTSINSARAMQIKLAKQNKVFKRMQCVAEVAVEPTDGKHSQANSKGHFDLHEYENASLASAVRTCHPVGS